VSQVSSGGSLKRGHLVLQPEAWPIPKGYANGIRASGDLVFVGGMVGWDQEKHFAADFIGQTKQALRNILAVLAIAGGAPEHVVRMTWYVVNMDEYRDCQAALGAVYREVMGKHYPAMTLVEVRRLVEPEALVEIEATAVLPAG
jgi:enamine deaminase RidA (YjgF/YER057c/UK114 family)